MDCKFSVVIPLYNKQAEIARCIRSVQAQTLKNFEVIIIDDGSQDEGPAIAALLCETDDRIRLFRQPNQGVAAARNKGVSLARAQYIAFLDADDELLPNHLTLFSQLAEQYPEAGMLFSAYWIDRGEGWRRRVCVPRRFLSRHTNSVPNYFLLPDGCIQTCSVVVRKDGYETIGGERKMYAEDIDMSLRMAAAYPVAYSPIPTSVWHVDANNRICIKHEQSATFYKPGSLLDSLTQIALDSTIPPITKARAITYVARREHKALLDTLLAGQRTHALQLYEWWQKQFNLNSTVFGLLLRCPTPVLRFLGGVRRGIRRILTISQYLLDLPASLSTFHGR
jgi:hypothetical protein